MFSMYMTLVRLIQALREAWVEPDFRNVLVLLLTLILSGPIFYTSVEGWGFIDSLYFSVVTLATVGYWRLRAKDVGREAVHNRLSLLSASVFLLPWRAT